LRAYDASNRANELYTGDQAAGGRDQLGTANKFAVPTIADGQVFVGTTNSLEIFGLLNGPTPQIQGAGEALVGNEPAPFTGVTVATFTSGDGSASPDDFNATINWGDGSTSQGTVSESGNTYIVSGSHTYQSLGYYNFTVSVIGDLAAATIGGGATIHDAFLPDGTTLMTPNQYYIAQVYVDLLHRSVDPSGLALWSGRLDQGLSRAAFTFALAHGDEYYAIIIQADYQAYLGRAADVSGLNNWTAAMRNGMSDEQLEAGFVASNEFYAHVGGTNKAFVDALYSDLLGRPAEFDGQDIWLKQMNQGVSRYSIALSFATSPEREASRIQADYERFLVRPADPDEVSFWENAFIHGLSNEDVAADFTASPEYYNRHSQPA